MGKKEPKQAESLPNNQDGPARSGIFDFFFGEALVEGSASSSLFSEDNPFRRKPVVSTPMEKVQNGMDSDATKLKKRKSHASDTPFVEEGAGVMESNVDTKRIRNLKKVVSDLGSDLGSGSCPVKAPLENYILNIPDPRISDKREKKKRKRDEIEGSYEIKKYGVVTKDEEPKKVGQKRKKADEVDDFIPPKEGFDDDSKLSRTVFIGNLPLKIKKKKILKEFSRFGEVESVRIRSVPLVDTKKTRKAAIIQKEINNDASSVHAYVVFKDEQAAEASLSCNMSLIAGNHIRVDHACPPRKRLKGESAKLYDPKRTLFVGNLPFDVKDEELYQLFTSMGNLSSSVEAVRVVRDPHLNVGKGIAYVLFSTAEAVKMVMKRGNLKLRDRILRFSRTRSDLTPSKRKSGIEANSPMKNLSASNSTPASKGDRSNRRSSLSYQGMRATKKSTDVKSTRIRPKGRRQSRTDQKTKKQKVTKERSHKRPSVAARKAKSNALKEVGIKYVGSKRKLESRTSNGQKHAGRSPESLHKRKRAKL